MFSYERRENFIKIIARHNRTGKAPDQQLISTVAVMMWYIHIGLFPSFYLSLTALLLALMVVIFICLVCFYFLLNWTTEWIKDISLKQERKVISTESLKLGKTSKINEPNLWPNTTLAAKPYDSANTFAHFLDISRDNESTTSLASLFQCSITLSVKNFFMLSHLNLPNYNWIFLPVGIWDY